MKTREKLLLSSFLLLTPLFFGTTTVHAQTLRGQVTVTAQKTVYARNSKGGIKNVTDQQGMPGSKEYKQGTVLTYDGAPKIIKGSAYYPLGNNTYVAAADTSLPTGPVTLQVERKSYIYTQRGKRRHYHGLKEITPAKVVTYAGKARETKRPHKYYSLYWANHQNQYDTFARDYFMIKQRFYLKYRTIKKHNYFKIGHNAYINANNVKFIAGKPVYKTGWTTIVMKHNARTYDDRNWKLKKGQKFRTKLYGYWPDLSQIGIPNNMHPEHPFLYYRVKLHGHKVNIFWTDAQPKRNIEFVNFYNLTNSFVKAKRNIHVYNVNGHIVQPHFMIDANGNQTNSSVGFYPINVNWKQYLYDPTTKKTALYYHLKNYYLPLIAMNSKDPNQSSKTRNVGSAFVKASQTSFSSGHKLKTVNTAKKARKGRHRARQALKTKLARLIRKARKLRKTNKYYLSSDYHLRRAFDYARAFGRRIDAKKRASTNEIEDAARFLKTKARALNGKKVVVKNIHHLTNYEATKVREKAIDALANSDEDVDVEFNKKHTVLREIEPDHRLRISDFARQRK